MKLSGRTAVVGGLSLVWLLFAALGGLHASELPAMLAAAALGLTVAVAWPAVGSAGTRLIARLDALLGATDGADRTPPSADDAADPDVAGDVVEEVLRTLAGEVRGRRLVIWRVDEDGGVVAPEHALGPRPIAGRAAGSPIRWCIEESSPMRVDPAPAWSDGHVVLAPIDRRRALSVETRSGEAPDVERLLPGARILAALLVLVDREVDARAERERLRRVTGFLQGLSRDRAPDRVPSSLGRAALDLVGGRGAAVASWTEERGVILTREGDRDGPEEGHEFGRRDGDLAHAARTGATVRRQPGDAGERPPLASRTEAWTRVAPYRVAVPLAGAGADGRTGGVVAVWGDAKPIEDGVALLEALGPLLSMHLRQATDLVRFRDTATVDALTELPNRAAFEERLADEQERFHRYRRPASLMVIDIDHFKRVNDTHGHAAGDAVLRAVGAIVRSAVRDVDFAARYGGEELVVLMPETMLRAAEDVAERVRTSIAAAGIEHEGEAVPVTASVGVSGCPERVDEPRRLFESADAALYTAKEAGRNRVVVAKR